MRWRRATGHTTARSGATSPAAFLESWEGCYRLNPQRENAGPMISRALQRAASRGSVNVCRGCSPDIRRANSLGRTSMSELQSWSTPTVMSIRSSNESMGNRAVVLSPLSTGVTSRRTASLGLGSFLWAGRNSKLVVGQFDCGRLPGWKRGRAGRIFVGWQMPLARTCSK
jgi:hypothetical protein